MVFFRCLALLLLSVAALAQSLSAPAAASSTVLAPRVKVAPDDAKAFVAQKAPVKYPDAARSAGLQGEVVLNIVVGVSGEVREVNVVSGDPTLAQAATDAIKQWKYKPYTVAGSPAEMETQVKFDFKIQPKPETARPPAPLGSFRHDTYCNEYFGLTYPLSRDWVRETEAMRKKIADGGGSQGAYILLGTVYIPEHAEPSQVDSSFTLLALDRFGDGNCRQYLEAVAANQQSRKTAQLKNSISPFSIAGRDFVRADFEYRDGPRYRSLICTVAKDYFLLWNIAGATKNAVETGVSTLNSLTPPPAANPASLPVSSANAPPTAEAAQSPQPQSGPPQKVKVNQGVSTGFLLNQVTPVYPAAARQAHIEGSVILGVEISKTGDITDVEVLEGPIDLVVSAVNAVRQWKYRPYLLLGDPVAVQTQIVVNYRLSR
jgi:protein TonB